MRVAARSPAWAPLLATMAVPLLVALLPGASGPRVVVLNLGPGDGPFVSGFAPPREEALGSYEISEGQATHWTTHDSGIVLPLVVEAERVGVRLRFARHLPDQGQLEVRLAGDPVARFDVQRGYREYAATVALAKPTPLALDLHVNAQDDRGLGISLDWVRFELPSNSRVHLSGWQRLRVPVTLALLAALLMGGGLEPRRVLAVLLPIALAAAFGLVRDPWLSYRLLRGVPEVLATVGVASLLLARLVLRRAPPETAALARFRLTLLLVVFVARAVALNHPDFYYPDYRVHARLVEVVRRAGFDLLRSPASWLYTPREARQQEGPNVRATSGLWLRSSGGIAFGLPYSLAPHALIAPWPLEHDGVLTALRMLGAFASAVPVAIIGGLAARGVAPRWAALLLAAAPTGMVELSLGAVPAVFGHAWDVIFVWFLAVRGARITQAAVAIQGVLLAALAALAYVSSALFLPALGLALGALVMASRSTPDRRRAVVTACVPLVGVAVAVIVYYRDFLDGVRTALVLMAAPGAAPLADPGGGRAAGALSSWGFGLGPVLAVLGLFLLWRERSSEDGGRAVRAWCLVAAAFVVPIHILPGPLGFLHLWLFATPLVAFGAAEALQALAVRGPRARVAAIVLALALVGHGVWQQVHAVIDQCGALG